MIGKRNEDLIRIGIAGMRPKDIEFHEGPNILITVTEFNESFSGHQLVICDGIGEMPLIHMIDPELDDYDQYLVALKRQAQEAAIHAYSLDHKRFLSSYGSAEHVQLWDFHELFRSTSLSGWNLNDYDVVNDMVETNMTTMATTVPEFAQAISTLLHLPNSSGDSMENLQLANRATVNFMDEISRQFRYSGWTFQDCLPGAIDMYFAAEEAIRLITELSEDLYLNGYGG